MGARHVAQNVAFMSGIYLLSEVTQQKLVLKKDRIDWRNVLNLEVGIICWVAPFACLWNFKLLNKLIPAGKSAAKTALTRAVVDPIVSTPVVCSGLFTILDMLEGSEDKFEKIKGKLPSTWLYSCLFWTPVQFVNFRFFPVRSRVYFISTGAFFWSNILCYVKNST